MNDKNKEGILKEIDALKNHIESGGDIHFVSIIYVKDNELERMAVGDYRIGYGAVALTQKRILEELDK